MRRMNKIKEMEPNVITYSSVINAYANKGNWQVRTIPMYVIKNPQGTFMNQSMHPLYSQGAENVLRRMQYQGVQPNIITYNSLVTAYAKEGNWQVRRMHSYV